ncbi:hypothetical protein MPL3356_410010 [Mesorhizobium plurifarium]|uniref:Uncharacterized protein n=1 Tax=Mesorhizobium plurifarium TaxID=69974 RepID=A0A090GUW0_MESPL|nr:hypothetical protein MPL3356_410010 [Mesorhizobium plurifarium]CDX57791.1 hypothetical protein MPL3365_280054 [Mesorhizobium plurifarium]
MPWPVLLNAEKAPGRLASADSHLPFQDWRWLVTRPETEGKRVVTRRAGFLFGAEKGIEQSMTRRRKRIYDSYAAPSKAVL